MHGIQSWIGLPEADEEAPPAFQHFASAELPEALKPEDEALKIFQLVLEWAEVLSGATGRRHTPMDGRGPSLAPTGRPS